MNVFKKPDFKKFSLQETVELYTRWYKEENNRIKRHKIYVACMNHFIRYKYGTIMENHNFDEYWKDCHDNIHYGGYTKSKEIELSFLNESKIKSKKRSFKEFNLNQYVKVKLTPEGQAILNSYYNKRFDEYTSMHFIPEENVHQFQMHQLMVIFGDSLLKVLKPPLEMNVLIEMIE